MTAVLVGLNVLVFVLMALRGVSPVAPTTGQLISWGANFGPLALTTEPWRILSSNYLHIGILHILLNMWCLWSLGGLAERIFDPVTYFLTYTACGIAGSISSLLWHPVGVGAGASGAIFGLAGALIAALYLGKLPIPKYALQPTMRSLLTFAGYNLLFGAVGRGVDNSAHFGGLIAGLIIGALLARHLVDSPDVRARWRMIVFAGVILALFGAYSSVRKIDLPIFQRLTPETSRLQYPR